MDVFDAAGRWIRTLSDGPRPSGRVRARWDRRSADGVRVSAGTYYVRLPVDDIATATCSVVIVE